MPEPEPGAEGKVSFLPCFLVSVFSIPPFPRWALGQGRGARLEAPGVPAALGQWPVTAQGFTPLSLLDPAGPPAAHQPCECHLPGPEEGEGRWCSSEKVTAAEQRPSYCSVRQAKAALAASLTGSSGEGSPSSAASRGCGPPTPLPTEVVGLCCAWLHGCHGFICVEYSRRR